MAGREGVSVLYKYFGKKTPDQKLAEFADETKMLTDTEFEQLKTGIENGTLTY